MQLILDTNILIHWILDADRLSNLVYQSIVNPETDIFISQITVWEIQIKSNLGKLDIGGYLPEVITEQIEKNNFKILELSLEHIYTLEKIPPHHRDPFDRLLIAQSLCENLPIATTDRVFHLYDIQIIE